MTQDDTFAALKRVPFRSVLGEIAAMAGTPDDTDITRSVWAQDNKGIATCWTGFFEVRGWTIQEFEKECNKK